MTDLQQASADGRRKLLPCPFCGGIVRIARSRIPYSTAFQIKCEPCGVNITRQNNDLYEAETRAAAIAAWNRRAKATPDTSQGEG